VGDEGRCWWQDFPLHLMFGARDGVSYEGGSQQREKRKGDLHTLAFGATVRVWASQGDDSPTRDGVGGKKFRSVLCLGLGRMSAMRKVEGKPLRARVWGEGVGDERQGWCWW